MSATRSTAAAITLLSLVSVAGVLVVERTNIAPGPLAAVHGRDLRLGTSGDGSCVQCHADGRAPSADACLECHADVARSVERSRGLHGSLPVEEVQQCARCHADHQGTGFAMVNAVAFARAGVPDVQAYDHGGLDYPLEGVHADLACEHCHENALARPLPERAQRFLGLDASCIGCHADPHEGTYGGDCASCHGQEDPFPEMSGLAHETVCPLVGAHATLSCADCHADPGPWSVAALVERHADSGPSSVPARDCQSCHVSPHARAFTEGVAALAASEAGGEGACLRCHSAEHESFLGQHDGNPEGWHAASGFALETPHAELACASCHSGLGTRPAADNNVSQALLDDPWIAGVLAADGPRAPRPPRSLVDFSAFDADFPGRTVDACDACHGDPHGGQFATGPFAGDGCLACHEREAFAPAAFDAERHELTAFPLVGRHADAACRSCHTSPAGQPERTDDGASTVLFAGTASDCAACHTAPHRSPFVQQTATAHAPTGDCAVCHAASHETFVSDQAAMDPRLHAATGFGLEGPHDAVACADCHAGFGSAKQVLGDTQAPAAVAGFLAPPSPRLLAAFPGRTQDDCAACHGDPHDGQFEGGTFAGEGCLACHCAERFVPVAFDLDHHARTRFPLDGGHEGVACSRCHQVTPEAAAPSERVFVGTPTDCASCHEDPHVGQFAQAGDTDCMRCHVAGAGFAARAFDHQRDSRFGLEDGHEQLACSACHRPASRDDGTVAVRYKPLGVECGDCHAPGSVRELGR